MFLLAGGTQASPPFRPQTCGEMAAYALRCSRSLCLHVLLAHIHYKPPSHPQAETAAAAPTAASAPDEQAGADRTASVGKRAMVSDEAASSGNSGEETQWVQYEQEEDAKRRKLSVKQKRRARRRADKRAAQSTAEAGLPGLTAARRQLQSASRRRWCWSSASSWRRASCSRSSALLLPSPSPPSPNASLPLPALAARRLIQSCTQHGGAAFRQRTARWSGAGLSLLTLAACLFAAVVNVSSPPICLLTCGRSAAHAMRSALTS